MPLLGRTAGPFSVALLALAALAWVALVATGGSASARYLSHHGLDDPALGGPWFPVLFAFGWTVMIVAMMLPTSLPLVGLFERLVEARSDRTALVSLLLGGYLAAWLAVGLLMLGADAGVHALLARDAAAWVRAPLLSGGVLLLAGLYQFTPLKRHCLTRCRSPKGFILRRWHGEDPRLESLRLGVEHGLFCVGCCWSLMLVMFAVGVGSLGWMLALGAVMGIEKNAPWGARISTPLGVALCAWGLVVAAGLWPLAA